MNKQDTVFKVYSLCIWRVCVCFRERDGSRDAPEGHVWFLSSPSAASVSPHGSNRAFTSDSPKTPHEEVTLYRTRHITSRRITSTPGLRLFHRFNQSTSQIVAFWCFLQTETNWINDCVFTLHAESIYYSRERFYQLHVPSWQIFLEYNWLVNKFKH